MCTHELAWEALTLGLCLFWTSLTKRLSQLSVVQPDPWQLPSCCGAVPGCPEPPGDPGSPPAPFGSSPGRFPELWPCSWSAAGVAAWVSSWNRVLLFLKCVL